MPYSEAMGGCEVVFNPMWKITDALYPDFLHKHLPLYRTVKTRKYMSKWLEISMSDIRIGHNNGPQMKTGLGWQQHCWKVARKDVLGKTIPIEIVRMRIKRARQLGMAYPQYASIILGTGRDIVGFLFTVDGMHLKLRKRLEMPEFVQSKLQTIEKCTLMAFSPSGEKSDAFQMELQQISGVKFKSSSPEPEPEATWPAVRLAVRAALEPLKLPSDAIVMIGNRETEKQWALAGKMARFIPSSDYYETPTV
jgi:hypothetical protein